MLATQVLQEESALDEIESAWDDLAVQTAHPFCAPAWLRGWWRHVAPERAHLFVICVREGNDLIGIAPLFASHSVAGPTNYRVLGSGTSVRREPLAAPGREAEVADAIATALKSARPSCDVLVFEGVPTTSPWPALIRDAMTAHRPPYRRRAYPTLAPTLELAGSSYDEWLASTGSHFRTEFRRRRRRLEERGAVFALADTWSEADGALRAFFELHHSRWAPKGGSGVLDSRVERMLLEAAEKLVPLGRFRIWTIKVGDDIISAQIFVAAGGEVAYWLGGFDSEWAKLGPSIQTVAKALEHAWSVGDKRLDLGAGAQDYKYSFAQTQDVLEWVALAPRALRYPLARLQLVPSQMREAIAIRLSPKTRERIKRALARR